MYYHANDPGSISFGGHTKRSPDLLTPESARSTEPRYRCAQLVFSINVYDNWMYIMYGIIFNMSWTQDTNSGNATLKKQWIRFTPLSFIARKVSQLWFFLVCIFPFSDCKSTYSLQIRANVKQKKFWIRTLFAVLLSL